METQDSIDIAKLQRVALGLEHEPSQSFSNGLTTTDSTSRNESSPTFVHPSNGDPRSTGPALSAPLSSSTSDSSKRHLLPSATKHYAKASMNIHNSAPKANGTQPEQMETAEGGARRYTGCLAIRNDSHNGADGATLMTLHEGDSGHLDILAEFNSNRHERNQSPANDEESLYGQSPSSPIADNGIQPEFFPESQRFLTTTPATAIKKTQTPGTAQTPSASRNPLAADIGSSGGLLMGLSQAFKNTQAPSSPLVHGLQSELASDRPSPNVPIQQRIHNPISSPLINFAGQYARESSEPNLNYISMKESQSNRDKTLGERLTRSEENLHSGDQIDQEFNKEPPFLEAARHQRKIDQEAAAQFAALNGPDQPRSDAKGAGSEEETEQEEDMPPQVPQSQEDPDLSMEEDKENYIGSHEPIAATSSAHDRLSQALGFEGSQSGPDHFGDATNPDADGSHDSENQLTTRSSQVMVKDSQQEPQGSLPQENLSADLQALPEDMEIDTHIDVARTSPVRQRIESPLPASRSATGHSQTSHGNSQEENLRSSHQNGTNNMETHPTNASEPESSRLHSGIPPVLQKTGSCLAEKSSSLPSHIKETPIHLRPSVGDPAQMSKIPNTSPDHQDSHRWEGESNGNNEDDDLPPMFAVGNSFRLSQRQSQTRAQSSPIKGKPSILSSPSGRQRRRLMDIASDTSPQVHGKVIDFDMTFFENDPDFNALIQGSPTRPRKKRRGNLGQSYNTSEASLPSPPHAEARKIISPIREIPSPTKTQSSADLQLPTSTVRNQPGPSRRAEQSVWEIESSPQQIMPRRSRSRRMKTFSHRRSQPSAEPPAQVPTADHEKQFENRSRNKPEDPPRSQSENQTGKEAKITTDSQPAARRRSRSFVASPHHSSVPPSSELTELGIGSEDLLPSENPPSSHANLFTASIISLWPDRKRAYYPGTCLGTPLGSSEAKYSVKLEDSAPIEVNKIAVKRLELRVGDGVKVDMPGVPKVTHIVRGFEDKLTSEELSQASGQGEYPLTDIFGYSTLVLGLKQRKSLPGGGLNNNSEKIIRVPLRRIYLDTILWNQLKDRPFTYHPTKTPPQKAPSQEARPQTPAKSSIPPSPSSRFSRNTHGVGIFSNMAFAVSYKEDDVSKKRVTSLIQDNGGTILRTGFSELFDSSSVLPISSPAKGQQTEKRIIPGLQLTQSAQNIGFTCLIADMHSRREKYMQALALGFPCLSGRWVEDCITQGRLLDWDIYLLPAGDSMYLNGATKSRMMVPTPPSKARLAQTISGRPKLLAGNSVLIVTGRGKVEEKRKAYIFLTYALGASRVERVPDLETAKTLLGSQADADLPFTWDFVYVEDSDRDAAKAMLAHRLQGFSSMHGRKRKKSTAFNAEDSDANSTTRVIGNEFVCQSLILGRLFEE
ncbi:uncharacterized protein N7469_002696 [Penicillium citrinum]|uniref:BRCT domain-containing protein n=1 Tax=Penicillium citrinum TaxID=5077 RepID=A0A9W9TTS2_PENCI|nr:uncharacterized protein N7469_002696 [Penicillium citrinum]KAJ5241105.1 hypothetical protein N7469_002696 [Penicillium citrinum]